MRRGGGWGQRKYPKQQVELPCLEHQVGDTAISGLFVVYEVVVVHPFDRIGYGEVAYIGSQQPHKVAVIAAFVILKEDFGKKKGCGVSNFLPNGIKKRERRCTLVISSFLCLLGLSKCTIVIQRRGKMESLDIILLCVYQILDSLNIKVRKRE